MKSRQGIMMGFILPLLVGTLACALAGSQAAVNPPESEPSGVEATVEAAPEMVPDQAEEISEPGGAVLRIDPGALDQDSGVFLEETGDGDPFTGGSPFSPASAEYLVDLGGAQQVGAITLSVPLGESYKFNAAPLDLDFLAWVEPENGFPSVVGVLVKEDQALFPVVGSGTYQVFAISASRVLIDQITIFDPLAVPTYPQRTSSWCSPTALTNLVQYHQGSWPVGGLGSAWGESSNWYLAGQAGQPFNQGYFFHWLLGAGGYAVPSNVKESFLTSDHEVIIWNWYAAIYSQPIIPDLVEIEYANTAFAEALFDVFQSYVENHVWGMNGERRPVAWGSSLAGHSRTITGSDGTSFFNNNPSSGSLNSVIAWDDYRQQILDSYTGPKVEVIDTVVLHAAPRPEEQRRGVIWLLNADSNIPGSVAMVSGQTGSPATKWVWDGELAHDNGYYYEDQTGTLPDDPVLGSQFQLSHAGDRIDVSYSIFNISDSSWDFQADVVLLDGNLAEIDRFGASEETLSGGHRQAYSVKGSYLLKDLSPGMYTLKFMLWQDGIAQDAKYVQFMVAPPVYVADLSMGVLVQNAFCRKGPGPEWVPATSFDAGAELLLVGVNEARTWGNFEAVIGENRFRCWIALSVIDNLREDQLQPVIATPPLPVTEPQDNQAPTISISHSPSGAGFPKETEQVTFTATAADNTAVTRIRIWVTPPGGSSSAIKTCDNTTSCIVPAGPYATGELTYWAKAWDAADNSTESSHTTITIFAVPR